MFLCSFFTTCSIISMKVNTDKDESQDTKEEDCKKKFEKMVQTYLDEESVLTKEYCDKGFFDCSIDVERDLPEALTYGFTQILKVYLMFYDPALEKLCGGDKNVLFYVVNQQNIKAIRIILTWIQEDQTIINVKNHKGKTVVEVLLEKCFQENRFITKDEVYILNLLTGHENFDFEQKNNDGMTIFSIINEYTRIVFNNQEVTYELLLKNKAKQHKYCPEFCMIL